MRGEGVKVFCVCLSVCMCVCACACACHMGCRSVCECLLIPVSSDSGLDTHLCFTPSPQQDHTGGCLCIYRRDKELCGGPGFLLCVCVKMFLFGDPVLCVCVCVCV